MTPAATALLSVIGVLVWLVLGLLVAIAIGLSIREADSREAPHTDRKDCCPHDPAKAPAAVRGQFRAIIVPATPPPAPRPEPTQPAQRLDVYL